MLRWRNDWLEARRPEAKEAPVESWPVTIVTGLLCLFLWVVFYFFAATFIQ